MISRILLAANDSPAALAAGRVCIALATGCGATVRAVTVGDGGPPGAPDTAADPVLRHFARLAADAHITFDGVHRAGPVAPTILAEAASWKADLIVMGRSDPRLPGRPDIGHHTRHVLEFADAPVLVVPPRVDARHE
jgi:nucleotide-binding universal stress UspA family protein